MKCENVQTTKLKTQMQEEKKNTLTPCDGICAAQNFDWKDILGADLNIVVLSWSPDNAIQSCYIYQQKQFELRTPKSLIKCILQIEKKKVNNRNF